MYDSKANDSQKKKSPTPKKSIEFIKNILSFLCHCPLLLIFLIQLFWLNFCVFVCSGQNVGWFCHIDFLTFATVADFIRTPTDYASDASHNFENLNEQLFITEVISFASPLTTVSQLPLSHNPIYCENVFSSLWNISITHPLIDLQLLYIYL